MGAPIIGLTAYGADADGPVRLPAEYVDAVRRAGGVPVLLPPGEADVGDWLRCVDGLIFTGGGDLDPALYGGARVASIYRLDAARDANELALARRIAADDTPCLCICRGAQVLNVALGGTLIEHLPDEGPSPVQHRSESADPIPHDVTVEPGTRLAEVLGVRPVPIVSWHHQAVRALGRGLRVTARAADGVIEGLELDGRARLLAVQWHPELSADADALQQGLFDWLVKEARA
jgi:putative glutamine amidotransferase